MLRSELEWSSTRIRYSSSEGCVIACTSKTTSILIRSYCSLTPLMTGTKHIEIISMTVLDTYMPIDFIPICPPVIHNNMVCALGTFMSCVSPPPNQLMWLEGAFAVEIGSNGAKVLDYLDSNLKKPIHQWTTNQFIKYWFKKIYGVIEALSWSTVWKFRLRGSGRFADRIILLFRSIFTFDPDADITRIPAKKDVRQVLRDASLSKMLKSVGS